MANSTAEPEFDLKKRLVGAFILIGFGVVVLPAVLGGRDLESNADRDRPQGAPDPKVFVSKITPIGGETPKLTTAPPEPDTQIGSPSPGSGAAAPAQSGSGETTPASPAETGGTGASKTTTVASQGPGWVVRVGTFAKGANVERVVQRLQQAGFEASTTEIETDDGKVTRVWIGPFAQRVEAARMRNRVKQVTGSEGYIAVYP